MDVQGFAGLVRAAGIAISCNVNHLPSGVGDIWGFRPEKQENRPMTDAIATNHITWQGECPHCAAGWTVDLPAGREPHRRICIDCINNGAAVTHYLVWRKAEGQGANS